MVGKHPMEVVGVVGDSVYRSLRSRPAPTFYDSYVQRPGQTYATFVALRTAIAPGLLLTPIAAAVARVAPTVPMANFKTQEDQIADSTGRERVFERLLTLFASFAIVLACIGLYGLTSYAVARRTNEIGIRLALGARRSHVQGLMLRQVVVLAVVGLAAGVPLAMYAATFVASFVYGVEPRDPLTLTAVSVTMLAAAIAAGWLPARRASRMEPLSALRRD
jgi:ABC-type antimicrobial peptide transport system permease subunit